MQQQNKPTISLWGALIPVIILVILLSFNVTIYGDDALGGSNQFILLIGAAVAAVVGFRNKVSYDSMLDAIGSNLKSTTGAILILLFVGALAGTWLLSGIIPAMIYYGLQILHPSIFLPACIIICAIISIATGSSWTTSATVGIALIGIGRALDIPVGMVAGAVISGAYFGDKLSPLSDTTNLAPAMAGSDLFTHIKYMTHTTVPSIIITMIVFLILGFFQNTSGAADTDVLLTSIKGSFTINLWLFVVPILVIFLIMFCNFLIFTKLHSIKVGSFNFLFLIFFINLFDSLISISIKKTSAPCSQKCSTIEAPIPEPPPVIKTLLFFKSS